MHLGFFQIPVSGSGLLSGTLSVQVISLMCSILVPLCVCWEAEHSDHKWITMIHGGSNEFIAVWEIRGSLKHPVLLIYYCYL